MAKFNCNCNVILCVSQLDIQITFLLWTFSLARKTAAGESVGGVVEVFILREEAGMSAVTAGHRQDGIVGEAQVIGQYRKRSESQSYHYPPTTYHNFLRLILFQDWNPIENPLKNNLLIGPKLL